MIEFKNVSLRRGRFELKEISFTILQGQYSILLGESGCGKTTLAEAIAGLLTVAGGQVRLNDTDVTAAPPFERPIGYVPQDLVLFPSMSVRENLEFGLSSQQLRNRQSDIDDLAKQLQLTDLLLQRAHTVSRGQAQRIALARALAIKPSILILDEPLSSLDDETRHLTVSALRTFYTNERPTVLHVTHQPQGTGCLSQMQLRLVDGVIHQEDDERPGAVAD